MKKKLFISALFLFTALITKAQCDTSKFTIKAVLGIEIKKWNYYKSNGDPAWLGVADYDQSLIPKGGYVTTISSYKSMDGYITFSIENMKTCNFAPIDFFDFKMKRIKGNLVNYTYR